MRRRWLILVLALALPLGSCYGYGDDEADDADRYYSADAPDDRPTFDRAKVLLDTEEGSRLIDVEVADTPEKSQFGLMFRTELPRDEGMIFIYFEDTTGGFWMKNTLIPLSIAYFDLDGEIVDILDMEPCEEEFCPTYDPSAAYRGALEVNQGAFERWGVEIGDTIRITR